MTRSIFGSAILFTFIIVAAPARADVKLIGVAELPGNTADLSGLTGKHTDGTPHNQLGGLSGVAYTGKGDEYVHVADRGPKDGAIDYACRYHRMIMRVDPMATPAVALKLTGTTLLTNEKGQPLVGSLDALDPKVTAASVRFDPEGVRFGRNGELFISDEYGPFLSQFDAKGRRVKSFAIPKRFQPARFSKKSEDELPPHNTVGRIPNRGMEGLAITPDGSKLYGFMQSPLIQDGALDKDNKRIGRNIRILEVDIATNKTREFVYTLDDVANGVNEILAVNDHQFLVLERDSIGGKEAAYKKLNLIDLASATDVSAIDALPTGDLPASIKPVKKEPFLNLLDPKFGIAGENCPEKFEGIAFGPDLPNGRRLLILTADNDFITEQPFRVYAFAVDRADLPEFVPQQLAPAR